MLGESIRITSLGHAGFRIDGADLSLVMDPWFAPQGAFQASWYQFPGNGHLDQARLLDCDFATLSHEHLDHMDASALTRLPERTKLLVPTYPSPHLRQRLAAAGVRNVIEVPAWEKYQLNERGDWLTFIPEQSPMCHDAAVLVCAGGASVLHCNDARLTVGQARRAAQECGGRLDVLAAQMAGASWHPICYDYPEPDMAQICAMKRSGKFKAVAQLIRKVEPRLSVPFAGPMCFLDPELQHHNRWIPEPGLFPDQRQATEFLAGRLPPELGVGMWMPGDTYDVLAGEHMPDPHWRDFSYDSVDQYIHEYAGARASDIARVKAAHPEPGPELGDAFSEHFRRLAEMSPYFVERIDMRIRFELTGGFEGTWDVDLKPGRSRVNLDGGQGEAQYRFRLDGRWLAPVIYGHLAWEDLFLSLRFSAWRHPDIYNDYLIGLLKHADPIALDSVQRYETNRANDEKMVVDTPRGSFEISRYCPHAGEDLMIGSTLLDDGRIRCLGHNLEFDIATGACVNARCDPLSTRPLAPERSLGNLEEPHLRVFG